MTTSNITNRKQASFSRRASSPERCKTLPREARSPGRRWKERGGASVSLFATPVSPKPKSKRKKLKEAERRQTLGNNRRILRCGARPFGARTLDGVPPRLSSRGVFHPQGQLQARLPGTRSERALPAFACPSPGMHLPSRSSCREADTQAAREQTANPPAGTALAPMTRCASAPCPSKERDLYSNRIGDPRQGLCSYILTRFASLAGSVSEGSRGLGNVASLRKPTWLERYLMSAKGQ
jgi:hypothetical protein